MQQLDHLFDRSQAEVILLKARRQVFEALQDEIKLGLKKPPSAEGFATITNVIQKLYARGE